MINKKHERDEPMTFILFENPKKTNRTHPDLVGKIILEDGTMLRLAGWERDTRTGGKYIGGKVNVFLTKEEVQKKVEEEQNDTDNSADDIDLPF
jgi:hypothetical protein